MSAWRKEPPTHDEWLAAKNHGYWWVKFKLIDEEFEVDKEDGKTYRWPEAWHTEIVYICDEMVAGKSILDGGRLVAEGTCVLKRFYLDDPDAIDDLYWQPVASPMDDERDKRPRVD